MRLKFRRSDMTSLLTFETRVEDLPYVEEIRVVYNTLTPIIFQTLYFKFQQQQ
jgi:hypothetical protein